MHAKPGDQIVIDTAALDAPGGTAGEVLEVIGQGEREHYGCAGTTATSRCTSRPGRPRGVTGCAGV